MTTRREVLKFAGGSAVGLMLTPAPWRLLTDTALWSENWPGVPRPVRGEIRFKLTHCPLCPAGCAVRARCVGDQPVAMAGVSGGLCPLGVSGHHVPYHPDRLRSGDRQKAASAVAAALSQMKADERLAVLDLRPGRTASWTYRRAMAALGRGVYLAPGEAAYAVDLSKARTVLSLGAPLLDGWGRPSRVMAARANFRLIQAEAVESGTAALADEWLAVRPGTEMMLGRAATGEVSVREAAEATGLPEARISNLVGEVDAIVTPGMTPEAAGWNIKIGAWGKTAFPRREAPVPKEWNKAAPVTPLAAVKDGSLRVLLIDESVPGLTMPWAAVEPKLARDAVVVAFAWSRGGYARHATHVLPSAVYPEALGDLPAPVDSPSAEFRLTVPLVAAPQGMTDPTEFVSALAGLDARNVLRERAEAIHPGDDFWKSLNAGSPWTGVGDRSLTGRPLGPAPNVVKTSNATESEPGPEGAPSGSGWWQLIVDGPCTPLTSPLLSKLSQESGLRLGPGRAALHPNSGFADGDRALLETPYGRCPIQVTLDAAVPPGVVLAGASMAIADILSADGRARVARI